MDVHDADGKYLYDVSEALRKLSRQIPVDVPTLEELDVSLYDLREELLQRQNRFFRALARELRKLNGKEK